MQLMNPHMKKSEVTMVKAKRLPEVFDESDICVLGLEMTERFRHQDCVIPNK